MGATDAVARGAPRVRRARRAASVRPSLPQEGPAEAPHAIRAGWHAGAGHRRTRWLACALLASLGIHAAGVIGVDRLARGGARVSAPPVPVVLLPEPEPAPSGARGPVEEPPPRASAPPPRRTPEPGSARHHSVSDASALAGVQAAEPSPPVQAAALPPPEPGPSTGGVAPDGERPAVPPAPTASDAGGVAAPVSTAARRVRGGYQVRPAYPERARRDGREGTTWLRVRISASGRVERVETERSAGDEALDRAASDAVRRWRFEAAPDGASRDDVWVLVPIEFRLETPSP